MDDADRAEERIEQVLEDAIDEARHAPPGPMAVGYCLFCAMPLAVGQRWCDAGCRDDWQAEQDSRQRKRGGK